MQVAEQNVAVAESAPSGWHGDLCALFVQQ